MRNLTFLIISLCLFVPLAQAADEGAATKAMAAEQAQDAADAAEVAAAIAEISPVYVKTIKGDFHKIYQRVFSALENNGYFVVFEPNIGKQLSHFKQRWGDKYNRNNIENIKSLVFCNAWYANEVSNQDPKLLAMCPMHITLTEKAGLVTILYIRPSMIARGSGAEKVAIEIEQDVLRSIEVGLAQ